MTPPTEAAERKSHSSNSLIEQRKPEQREKLRRKNARQRNKNNKHCILRRTRTKIQNACWGHPKPRNDRTAVIKNRLTPK